MVINFATNRYLNNKLYINPLAIILISVTNLILAFSIINLSGQLDSYFWVLLLLPIFTVSMTGTYFYFWIISIMVALGMFFMYMNQPYKDLVNVGKCFIEGFIVIGGGYIICKEVKAKYMLEEEVISKKKEIEALMANAVNFETEIQNPKIEEKLELISTSMHDIKNFLTIINLTMEIIERNETFSKEDILRIKYASKMSANLIYYAINSAKSNAYDMTIINITEPVNQAIETIKPALKLAGAKIEFMDKSRRKNIKGNPLLITRALLNILINSKSFLPEKNGVIKILIEESGNNLKIKISDNGPGFPKEIIEKIEPFKSFRQDEKGLGIGLYSSYNIVKQHNGEFKIYNDSTGAVVEISFPFT
ncbi:MAG: HAMP domain-containing histidine kinase [Elusimicrobiota bacterium]